MARSFICPLLSLGQEHLHECLGKNCAWYSGETEQCSMLQISDELNYICELLEELE